MQLSELIVSWLQLVDVYDILAANRKVIDESLILYSLAESSISLHVINKFENSCAL
jgi:hypothetical protein